MGGLTLLIENGFSLDSWDWSKSVSVDFRARKPSHTKPPLWERADVVPSTIPLPPPAQQGSAVPKEPSRKLVILRFWQTDYDFSTQKWCTEEDVLGGDIYSPSIFSSVCSKHHFDQLVELGFFPAQTQIKGFPEGSSARPSHPRPRRRERRRSLAKRLTNFGWSGKLRLTFELNPLIDKLIMNDLVRKTNTFEDILRLP